MIRPQDVVGTDCVLQLHTNTKYKSNQFFFFYLAEKIIISGIDKSIFIEFNNKIYKITD